MASKLAAIPHAQFPTKYRDVVKIALQPRQTRAFILAATAWHLLLTSALLRTPSVWLISPLVSAVSLVSFALGVLPLLTRQKQTLSRVTSPPSRVASSKGERVWAAVWDGSVVGLVYRHAVGFVVLALGYVMLLGEQSKGWGVQVWVESHGWLYLNERFVYLVGYSTILGGVYAVVFRSLPSAEMVAAPGFDAAVLLWDGEGRIKQRVVDAVACRVRGVVGVAGLTSIWSVVVYRMVRMRMWSGVVMVLGTRGVLRRLLVPWFGVEFGYLEVWMRTTLFSVAAVCAVEGAYVLLDVYLTQPLVAVSRYATNANRLLVDGLDESVVFFSNHAFGEMARLSADSAESRKLIYGDVNSDVTTWMHVRDGCIAMLRAQEQFVAHRGGMRRATQPSTPHAPQPKSEVETPPKRTIWDELAAGHPTHKHGAAALPNTTGNGNGGNGGNGGTVHDNAGACTRNASGWVSVASVASVASGVVGLIGLGWSVLPADAKHVLFGPRRREAVLGESPASEARSIAGRDAARVVGAVVTLKELVCHSLAEDTYGTVQKDIRRVLVAMADVHRELRGFGLELERRAKAIDDRLAQLDAQANHMADDARTTPNRTEWQDELRRAWRTSGAESVDRSLTASMRAILDTFGKFELQLGTELEAKLSECLS